MQTLIDVEIHQITCKSYIYKSEEDTKFLLSESNCLGQIRRSAVGRVDTKRRTREFVEIYRLSKPAYVGYMPQIKLSIQLYQKSEIVLCSWISPISYSISYPICWNRTWMVPDIHLSEPSTMSTPNVKKKNLSTPKASGRSESIHFLFTLIPRPNIIKSLVTRGIYKFKIRQQLGLG